MTQSQILFVNTQAILDPRIIEVWQDYPQHDWVNYHKINAKWTTSHHQNYLRVGTNVLPFKNNIVDKLDLAPPKYNPSFNATFADVTDRRYFDLLESHGDSEWLVLWSGGIDSTVVLASILRNAAPGALSRIHVACNRISVYENPEFYFKYVVPNFKIIDSTNLDWTKDFLKQYYILDGEPADQLMGGNISQRMQLENPNGLIKNCHSDPDELIRYLAKYTDDDFAQWFYPRWMENINSVDIPIETYHDFFWWTFFNLTWVATKIRSKRFTDSNDPEVLRVYLDKFKPWFESHDYQQWSMRNNQPGVKYGNHPGEYKLAFKQYIYEFDQNEYYFNFKTKGESASRIRKESHDWFCVLEDLTQLSLSRDRERILELLPAHIMP